MSSKWLDKEEYPFTSNYFEINGQNLHYIDEGRGEKSPVAIFISLS
jgi:hypothetical protein